MMLLEIALLEPHGGMDDQLGLVTIAFKQPNQAVARANAFDDVLQNGVEQFPCRECLRVGGGKESKAAKLRVELFVPRPSPFENENDHGDAEGHAKEIVKGDAREKVGTGWPMRSIKAVACIEKEQSGEQASAVRLAGRAPQHPAGRQTKHTKQDGGFPADGTEVLRTRTLQIQQHQYRRDRKRPDG